MSTFAYVAAVSKLACRRTAATAFETEPFPIESSNGRRMTQEVRAMTWRFNPGAANGVRHNGRDTPARNRSQGSSGCQEHTVRAVFWPVLPQISQDGVADVLRHGRKATCNL